MKLKNNLKKWRHRLEIDTKTEFANLLGVQQTQISKWENHKGEPDLTTAWKLAEKLTEITKQKVYIEDLYEPEYD